MPRRKQLPELTFQQHIADFLVREHGCGLLEQAEVTDTEPGISLQRPVFLLTLADGGGPWRGATWPLEG
jgi:hypothetical protein